MKRLLLICVISLLFVSGWGHVLGLAFCPNMRAVPGCVMQRSMDSAAATTSTSAQSHEGMEMNDMQVEQGFIAGEADSMERLPASCCMNRPDAPSTPVVVSRGAEQSKKEPGATLQPTLKAIAPPAASFAPPVSSRQHAPPSPKTQRHVLINVFLI
jgi:hypothetical protein